MVGEIRIYRNVNTARRVKEVQKCHRTRYMQHKHADVLITLLATGKCYFNATPMFDCMVFPALIGHAILTRRRDVRVGCQIFPTCWVRVPLFRLEQGTTNCPLFFFPRGVPPQPRAVEPRTHGCLQRHCWRRFYIFCCLWPVPALTVFSIERRWHIRLAFRTLARFFNAWP